ncbi:MAG: hypothetical protein KatS3mg048_2096 [Caldilinea sp.]|nr:MAG: hypothetical protein KatS3mg048_2096 [Caldilinea sp.]
MARVKVLLVKDVPELGNAGEVYSVAGGYARNYLMPRGLAVLATRGALKQAEEIKAAALRRRARERANAEAQAQMIMGKRLLFTANAGENDRLYGSITTADIAEKLSQELGFEVDSPAHRAGSRHPRAGHSHRLHSPDAGRDGHLPGRRRARGRRLGRRRGSPGRQGGCSPRSGVSVVQQALCFLLNCT